MIRIFSTRHYKHKPYVKILWAVVAGLGAVSLFLLLAEPSVEQIKNVTPYAIFLITIAIVGHYLNWGPLIPCAIIGSIALRLIGPSTFHGWSDRMFFYSAPYRGAIIGGVVGLILELVQWIETRNTFDASGFLDLHETSLNNDSEQSGVRKL